MAAPKSEKKPSRAPAKPPATEPLGTALSWWLAIPLAVLGGCLVFLSFPTWDLFPLQWIALVPVLLALRGRKTGGAFFLGFLAGAATNIGGFHWIADLLREFGHMEPLPSNAIMVLMGLYQGLVTALAAAFAVAIGNRIRWPLWILFPILFTAVEHLLPLLFPWYFANGQQRFTAITQIVDITGVAGLTFLLVFVNAALAEIPGARLDKRRFPYAPVLLAILLFAGALGYGLWRLPQIDAAAAAAPKFRVGMVEADIGIWEKEAKLPDGSPMTAAEQIRMLYRNLLKHQYLSAKLERESSPDLIVWPESSYMPLHQVFSRRFERQVVVASRDGRLFYVQADGAAPVDEPGADAARGLGLRAVAAASEDTMVAVGPRGSAYLRDGDGAPWVREATGLDRDLLAVAVSPDGAEVLAVGDQGAAVFRQNGTWHPVELRTTATLRGATWSRDHGWVVCGDGGTLLAWRGKNTRPLAPEGLPDLRAVSWSAEGGLVAVGVQGTLVRIDADGRTAVTNPIRGRLNGVASGTVTWAVGDRGMVVACEDACRVVRSGTDRDLLAAVQDPGGRRAWATGADGMVLELDSHQVRLHAPIDGATGALVGAAWLPMRPGYPLPRDVRAVYASRAPLPSQGTADDPGPGASADLDTPARDRNAAVRGFSTPLLFGLLTQERDDRDHMRTYNSALLVDREGTVQGRYDKVFLLLFGEYLPFSDTFPFLKKWLPESSDFKPGTEVGVFPLGAARLGMLICYEDIIPSFTRRVAAAGPNVFVNITNDAWFGKTMEPYLHLQLAVFRTIEHRRALVRSTNTGVSAFVDPAGRRIQQTSLDGAETLVWDVPLLEMPTVYGRIGDAFAWACCGLGLILFGVSRLVPRRR
jgi:apolipoprotein N-acyltransferase/photosystem II stability/assembly factor-like uncharacterized protein